MKDADYTRGIPDEGIKPYAGSSGGGEAKSTEDEDGTTTRREREVIAELSKAKGLGLTYRELGSRTGMHHGQATGALSALHKQGIIRRLAGGKRINCSVYVLPDYVNGRALASYGKNRVNRDPKRAPFVFTVSEAEIIERLREALKGHPSDRPTMLVRVNSLKAILDIVDRATT